MLYNNKTKTRRNFEVKPVFMWAQNKMQKSVNINDLQAKMSLDFTQRSIYARVYFTSN